MLLGYMNDGVLIDLVNNGSHIALTKKSISKHAASTEDQVARILHD